MEQLHLDGIIGDKVHGGPNNPDFKATKGSNENRVSNEILVHNNQPASTNSMVGPVINYGEVSKDNCDTQKNTEKLLDTNLRILRSTTKKSNKQNKDKTASLRNFSATNAPVNPKNEEQMQGEPNNFNSKISSKVSISSSQSNIRRENLRIQRLEEERLLKLKILEEEAKAKIRRLEEEKYRIENEQKRLDEDIRIEKLHLEQKFTQDRNEILNEEDANRSTSSSSESRRNKHSSTEDWVDNQVERVRRSQSRVFFQNPERVGVSTQREDCPRSFDESTQKLFHKPTLNSTTFMRQSVPRNSTQRSERNINRDHSILEASQLVNRQAISRDLPNFDGDPMEWPIFYANFVSSTERCGFTNEENAIRLQKCLRGEARKKVRNLLILPNTVPAAISTLKMIYGRKDTILEVSMAELRSYPKIRTDDLQALIDLALMIQNTCAIIEMSDLTGHLTNPLIIQEIVEKLPTSLKLEWARYTRMFVADDLKAFSEWILTFAEDACKVIPSKSSKSIPNVQSVQQSAFRPQKPRIFEKPSFGHHAHIEEKSSETKRRISIQKNGVEVHCGYCQAKDHSITDCRKFKDLDRNKRWNFVHDNRLCRRCIEPHDFQRCRSRKKCGVDECNRNHNPLLHTNKSETPSASGSHQINVQDEPKNTVATTRTEKNSILFRVIPVVISGSKSSVSTYAFLDDGSSVTLIEERLANEIGADGPSRNLCLRWTNEETRIEEGSKSVTISIAGAPHGRTYRLAGVQTVKSLSLPAQTIEMNEMCQEYPYLKDLPVDSLSKAVPTILIGLDNWNVAVPVRIREGESGQPIASETRLGWTISGPSRIGSAEAVAHHFHICECATGEDLHQMVKNFFSLENFGVRVPNQALESDEDERAKSILRNTTVRVDGRFETGLLWRYDKVVFPHSYKMALRRLSCLETKMGRDLVLAEKLRNLVSDYVDKGYARKLLPDESHPESQIWYLPIFVVKNPNKPQKLRVVWDAAARVNGISLNDMLLKGPDQLTSLNDILWRFRQRRIAFTGDITEMFHQIRVRENDQHAQRFLWRDGEVNREPDVYVMKVMTFGATCSPSSAQFVKNLNASEYAEQFPEAANAIITNHYVDDWLESVDTVADAVKLIREVKAVHSKAGFVIGKWISNSREVLENVDNLSPRDARYYHNKSLADPNESEKVLGLWWSTETDCFHYRINYTRIDENILNLSRRPSKREVLKILMSIYDPLGLLSSFLVYVKILLQEVWRSGIDWDDVLLDQQHDKWARWLQLLPRVEKVEIPRWYTVSTNAEHDVQLHVFVDASENAYAAVAYFRVETSDGVNIVLVGAKTKVAPLRSLSIPRMELQSAVLGSRLSSSIINGHSIKISSCEFWTDSETVVRWLRSDHRKYKQFVALRVGEILETTNVNDWQWLGTKLNVADEATKWKTEPELHPNSRWFSGPTFLREPRTQWPLKKLQGPHDPEEELRTVAFQISHISVLSRIIPDYNRFSNWNRLKKSEAYVIRFGENMKAKSRGKAILRGPLRCEEIEMSVIAIYRAVQFDVFKDEIAALKLDPPQSIPRSSSIYTLSPYLDSQGVLRHKTRIDVQYGIILGIQNPIIMPRKHKVTELILLHFHLVYHHRNHETVVNEVRRQFVIPRLRATLKSVRALCQHCANKSVIPKVPEMAPLPMSRLAYHTRPFSYTGIDYFGPMEVVVGRRVEKRWGVIFTCLTVRAVHIEIASTLTTDSCILCIRNFIARRGLPIEFYTDNGTNFVGASNEFLRLESTALQEEFDKIKWTFNPPAAPHMGGAWERLIRSIKTTLCDILPTKRPSDEILRSVLMECENVVNSRPLTYIPTDPNEPEALTPNHFLLGSANGVKPLGVCSDDVLYMRSSYKVTQLISDMFWHRWLKDYLPTIMRRTKWFEKMPEIKCDDVVVIFEPNIRNSWRKGIVMDIIRGRDGNVRSVVVRTSTGIYTRPLTKVAVLDVLEKVKPNPQSSESIYKGEDVPTTGKKITLNPTEQNNNTDM